MLDTRELRNNSDLICRPFPRDCRATIETVVLIGLNVVVLIDCELRLKEFSQIQTGKLKIISNGELRFFLIRYSQIFFECNKFYFWI